ncbi:ATP-dependent RNA helicase A, partial [Hortaea werneckii]
MGVKTRRDVEGMIRGGAVWNVHDIHMSEEDRHDAVKRLAQIGFRPSHAEEATTICADFEECLEWLLIHLPEDDVPKWALPENYLAGVALVASDVQKDSKIKRLAEAGYSRDICSDVLESSNGDEDRAAFILQCRLLGEKPMDSHDTPGCSETWEEEQATLEAIYGERYQRKDRNCIIQLELQTTSNEPISLRVRLSLDYPNEMPAIAVEASLPAYIKLSILRQCLLHAQQHFLGEMMLFNILDWLEQEIPRIIEEPDKLQNLAGATATSNDPSKGGPGRTHKKPRSHPRPIVWTKDTPTSQRMQSEWLAKQNTADQQRMMQARQGLPAWRLRDAVVSSVRASQVTIISGETGSGKSTQSVQFVLDDLIKQGFAEQANIICTQPRRISALGLADRVADERCGKVGDEVGYTIRGESRQKAGLTRITFVTTGVLLRRLQTSGGSADDVVRSLADVSHVVIDEVHERSLDTDFLLVLLRDVLAKRKDLKLILMSATLDADVFESYFSRVSSVGRVEIEGRTHPVQDVYLDEIRQLVSYGSIEDEDADSDLGDDLADDFSVAGGRKLQQK